MGKQNIKLGRKKSGGEGDGYPENWILFQLEGCRSLIKSLFLS